MSGHDAILEIAEKYTKHLRALPLTDVEKEHICNQWDLYRVHHKDDNDTLDVVRAYALGFSFVFDNLIVGGKTIEEVRGEIEDFLGCEGHEDIDVERARKWLKAPKEARWYLLYCIEACLGGVINDLLPDILTEGNNIDVTAALVKDTDDTTEKFVEAFLDD